MSPASMSFTDDGQPAFVDGSVTWAAKNTGDEEVPTGLTDTVRYYYTDNSLNRGNLAGETTAEFPPGLDPEDGSGKGTYRQRIQPPELYGPYNYFVVVTLDQSYGAAEAEGKMAVADDGTRYDHWLPFDD